MNRVVTCRSIKVVPVRLSPVHSIFRMDTPGVSLSGTLHIKGGQTGDEGQMSTYTSKDRPVGPGPPVRTAIVATSDHYREHELPSVYTQDNRSDQAIGNPLLLASHNVVFPILRLLCSSRDVCYI